ncbi:hypothetical protein F4818DRAFT_433674 [Hypoxylon cercidicola]|nr:hypothetical protein F4818DRAFT_433674 [Hypoxylon cercidicola]
MANLGPLTTVFTPSGTGCQSIHMGLTTGLYWIQQGTISDCFPSNFRSQNAYYSPGICPESFSYACRVSVEMGSSTATAATCCPSGFACYQDRPDGDPNACTSTMDADVSSIVDVLSYTTGSPRTIGSTTAFLSTGERVFAKGLVVWRAATDAEWPASAITSAALSITSSSLTGSMTLNNMDSTPEATVGMLSATSTDSFGNSTASTATPTQTASPRLSTEVQVGLGVGISLGVLAFIGVIVAAYLLGRRRKQSSRDKPALGIDTNEGKQDPTVTHHELEEQRRVVELSSQREPAELMDSYD